MNREKLKDILEKLKNNSPKDSNGYRTITGVQATFEDILEAILDIEDINN